MTIYKLIGKFPISSDPTPMLCFVKGRRGFLHVSARLDVQGGIGRCLGCLGSRRQYVDNKVSFTMLEPAMKA